MDGPTNQQTAGLTDIAISTASMELKMFMVSEENRYFPDLIKCLRETNALNPWSELKGVNGCRVYI